MTRNDAFLITALAGTILVALLSWRSSSVGGPDASLAGGLQEAAPAVIPGESGLPPHRIVESGAGGSSNRQEVESTGSAAHEAAGRAVQLATFDRPQKSPGFKAPAAQGLLLHGHVREALLVQEEFEIACRMGSFRVTAKTDHLGNFQMRVPGAGTYWFTVEGDGRRLMTPRELSGYSGQFVAFEFSDGSVEGRVQDAEGAGVEGIQVKLKWVPQEGRPILTMPRDATRAISDHDGHFRFEHVPSGQFQVSADTSGLGSKAGASGVSEAFEVLEGQAKEGVALQLEPVTPRPTTEWRAYRSRHGNERLGR